MGVISSAKAQTFLAKCSKKKQKQISHSDRGSTEKEKFQKVTKFQYLYLCCKRGNIYLKEKQKAEKRDETKRGNVVMMCVGIIPQQWSPGRGNNHRKE